MERRRYESLAFWARNRADAVRMLETHTDEGSGSSLRAQDLQDVTVIVHVTEADDDFRPSLPSAA
jgi:hypothetical protein